MHVPYPVFMSVLRGVQYNGDWLHVNLAARRQEMPINGLIAQPLNLFSILVGQVMEWLPFGDRIQAPLLLLDTEPCSGLG